MIILRLMRTMILSLGILALLWLGGLVLFAEHVRRLDAAASDSNPTQVDAIVVLTGGSDRVKTGVELLKQGKGKKLFISGVHPGLPLEPVLSGMDVDNSLRECCIVLGHAAGSTEGNAEETQNWLALQNYHSIRLVTGNYHMPRSLLMFRTAMPDLVLIPHPVMPENVLMNGWWKHSGTASLLVSEYNKFLFAWVDINTESK